MLHYHQICANRMQELPSCEPGCIISLITPNAAEIDTIRELTGFDQSVIDDALDPDERPRIVAEEDCLYIVFRAPWVDGNENREDFTTPVTIAFAGTYTVIFDPHACQSVHTFLHDHIRHVLQPTRCGVMAGLFHAIADRYLGALRTLNTSIKAQEKRLGNMSDSEQLALLHMQNCLIYFQAALRGNELIIERILSTRLRLEDALPLEMGEADIDMMEDTLINIRQAAYTSKIYAEIMDCLLRTHSAVIGARVNIAMKVLTSLTLVLMIPTLVTSAYGMNVPLPFQNVESAFIGIAAISVTVSIISVYYLWKKGWFSAEN